MATRLEEAQFKRDIIAELKEHHTRILRLELLLGGMFLFLSAIVVKMADRFTDRFLQ